MKKFIISIVILCLIFSFVLAEDSRVEKLKLEISRLTEEISILEQKIEQEKAEIERLIVVSIDIRIELIYNHYFTGDHILKMY